VLDDVDVLVEALEHLLGGVDFEFAYGGLRVDDLALEVGFVDDVEVNESEGAYSGGREVEGERGSEASGAYAEDAGSFELLLAFHAYLGKDEVAGVAGDLLVGELGELDGFFDGCRHSIFLGFCSILDAFGVGRGSRGHEANLTEQFELYLQ
jgi:hypothetical protein